MRTMSFPSIATDHKYGDGKESLDNELSTASREYIEACVMRLAAAILALATITILELFLPQPREDGS